MANDTATAPTNGDVVNGWTFRNGRWWNPSMSMSQPADSFDPSTTPAPGSGGGATLPPPVVTPPTPGAEWSVYNPAPGTDPTWDAFLATFTAQTARRNAEADQARGRISFAYDDALASLTAAEPTRRKTLESSLLARGVGRSGEAQRRRTDLEGDLYRQRADADRARLEGLATIDSGLETALTDLAAQREQEIAASRLRLLKDGEQVPGVDTPDSGSQDPYTPPKKKSSGGGRKSGGSPPPPPNRPPSGGPPPVPPGTRPPSRPSGSKKPPSKGGGVFYS